MPMEWEEFNRDAVFMGGTCHMVELCASYFLSCLVELLWLRISSLALLQCAVRNCSPIFPL
jgi:hypothetical protein